MLVSELPNAPNGVRPAVKSDTACRPHQPRPMEGRSHPRMIIDQELAEAASSRDSSLTIGVFDGVHRGHRHLINQLTQEAATTGRAAGIVTFRDHPAAVLRPDSAPKRLTSLEERLRLLKELGVDFVVPITFNLELSALSAEEFTGLLQKQLGMRGLVVGPDFALGRSREGDVSALTALGRRTGFSVKVVDLLTNERARITSTGVRKALDVGDVESAASILGRCFALTGVVVRGEGRGRELGFPTTNLEVSPESAIPSDGIYATWAHLGDQCYMAATSIGTRPTFDEGERTIESFLLDFEGDLYGREVRLEFVQRLRDELKYTSVEALVEQIDKDAAQTRSVLQASQRPAG